MTRPTDTRFFDSEHAEYAELAGRMRALAPSGRPLRILEAGCGREWFVKLDGVHYEITGIDLDQHALDARLNLRKDLQRGIHGDLKTAELEAGHYDVVYSSYVLEHIPGAEQAVRNFATWAAPGGMIIIRVPDQDSVHGLLTRLTPFWFHVLYYKWVEGQPNAGKPGFAPYHTVYDEIISRDGMRRFAAANGLELVAMFTHGGYARGPRLFQVLIPAVAKTISLLTLGRYSAKSSNLTFILRKPQGAAQAQAPAAALPARAGQSA